MENNINPGDKLWFIIFSYSRRGDIIIPVSAVEVNDIYQHSFNPELGSCWRNRDIDGTDYVSVPTSEKDANGWPVYEKKDPSWLGDAKPVNQLVWIDEPVGHSLHFGRELFFTLQDAQRNASPAKKKHLKRRLNNYRRSASEFKYPEKKIYVRKKR